MEERRTHPENAVADGMVDEAETQEETAGMEDDETITNEDEIMLDDATTLDDGIELDETNTLDEELAAIAATADAGSTVKSGPRTSDNNSRDTVPKRTDVVLGAIFEGPMRSI